MDKATTVKMHLDEGFSLRREIEAQVTAVVEIAEQMILALRRGNKILFMANGGSAADAQHLAAELAGKFAIDREPLPAVALTTNTSVLTAIANDYGFDQVFARQVKALARPGDVVVGISTSGNSPNVLQAMAEARRLEAVTVALTEVGGKLKAAVDHVLSVPSASKPRIQEVHITLGHIICHLVERELFGYESP